MFKRNKVHINPNTTDTVIGEGTVFEGKIKSKASLRIEGQIIGDIECLGDVIIGEKGLAKSNIQARNVTIAGNVQGNINTKGVLSIMANGKLNGNTSAHSLVIAEGGIFQGASKMDGKNAGPTESEDKDKQPSGSLNNSYNNSTAIL